MKEEEFYKKIEESIEIPVYYAIDDKGNVIIDEEGIKEVFEDKLKGILKKVEEDELKEIVKEKIQKIKNGNK